VRSHLLEVMRTSDTVREVSERRAYEITHPQGEEQVHQASLSSPLSMSKLTRDE